MLNIFIQMERQAELCVVAGDLVCIEKNTTSPSLFFDMVGGGGWGGEFFGGYVYQESEIWCCFFDPHTSLCIRQNKRIFQKGGGGW